jgi:hypothetical protein
VRAARDCTTGLLGSANSHQNGPSIVAFWRAALVILLSVAGCADKQLPPIDNSFCRIYQRLPDPADAVHLKKRENKVAILTNERTHLTECQLLDRTKSLHPR